MTIRLLEDAVIRRLRSSFINSVAQCVVELVQNSLDAMATTIEIHVNVAKYYVQVIDNGTGIVPEDMDKIGQRHATSKCHTLDDLSRIVNVILLLEALANLAEISILEIISKHSDYYDTYVTVFKGGIRLQHGPTRNNKRTKPGTTIIIRDLFYMFPVRRNSQTDSLLANELENVKRAIEATALTQPQVTFTLVDASIDSKIITTRKTTSNISTFRQLFGGSLAQSLEPVHVEDGRIKLDGFISSRGYHAKHHQYFCRYRLLVINYHVSSSNHSHRLSLIDVNNYFITRGELHKLIEDHFDKSSFGKKVSPKYGPLTHYSIINANIIPFSHMVEYFWIRVVRTRTNQNWSKIMDLLSKLISQFLECRGFIIRDDQASHVVTSRSSVKKTRIRIPRNLPLTFEDLAHIKTGGQRQYIFLDEELKGGLSKDKRGAEVIKIDENENECIRWNGIPSEGDFYIGLRAGNSGHCSKSTSSTGMVARVDRSRLRTSGHTPTNATLWAKMAFERWSNPVFKCDEAPMPFLKNVISSDKFVTKDATRSFVFGHRFNKRDIARAEVIGQFDDKFVVCKLPCSSDGEQDFDECKQKTRHILVLVDQHAADERVRVEMLMKEFFDPKKKLQASTEVSSLVETVQARPPIKIILTIRETQVAKRFEENFNNWGIYFGDGVASKQSNIPTSMLISTHADNDHSHIYVTHVPKMIADRCASDSRVMQEIVRQYMYWLESAGAFEMRLEDYGRGDWTKMISKCPKGILDIINSKACRGALMFNDRLTFQQCKELIAKLSLCNFPFQINNTFFVSSNPRPSIIPLVYLDEFTKQSSNSGHHKQSSIATDRYKINLEKFRK
ncbi:13986_t:CDS:10 [Acaulospora colombiana]|uniref:13986_t:CDS:1 n=1 Tax=Acaulospora colombiana TaxID=27376 RepID=A0ACA9KFK5_9GLOM|nr:13986_t:CDS:10 [Acaulospora colombiana]